MNQPDDTWIVVADAGLARIFRSDAELAQLTEIPSAAASVHGHVSGHGHGDKRDPKDRSEHATAKALANELHQAHSQHRYRDLVLVAAPSFLGMVRSELPDTTARAITGSISHDYTHRQVGEIRELVKKHLQEKPLPR